MDVTSAIFQAIGNWAKREVALIIDLTEGQMAERQS